MSSTICISAPSRAFFCTELRLKLFAVLCVKTDLGAACELFSLKAAAGSSDFLVDEKIVLEVDGKFKDARQIAGVENAYLAIDDVES